MKPFYKIYILTFIWIISTSFNSDVKWKLEKSKDGIQVFSYRPPGANLKQLKSHCKIKTSLASIISVLSDVEGYTKWIYKCSHAKKLKQINTNEMVYYTKSDAPWPVVDREIYAYNKIYRNKKTKTIYSISEPLKKNKIPLTKGLVRITDFYGKWAFTPLDNGEIEIDYYLKIDPAGSLPDWLVNMTLEIGPYQTMVNFKKEVLKTKHKDAEYEFIEE